MILWVSFGVTTSLITTVRSFLQNVQLDGRDLLVAIVLVLLVVVVILVHTTRVGSRVRAVNVLRMHTHSFPHTSISLLRNLIDASEVFQQAVM